MKYTGMLGVLKPFPKLGPFLKYAHMGMQQAMMVIMRSQEPGKGKNGKAKYGTSRKIRSTFMVLWDVSPESGGDIAFSASGKSGRMVATCNPSKGRLYHFFAKGWRARMGDIVSQDRAFTIDVVLKLLSMFELEYQEKGGNRDVHSLCSCMFLLLTCLGGTRGYEAVWTDLSALEFDVNYCEALNDFSAIAWPIVIRFKSHHGIAGCYMIPITGTTDLGIPFFKWTQRFIIALHRAGIHEGWAFQRRDGSQAKASDYKDNIFSKLEVQATTTLIDPECNIWDDYGMQRPGCRFFTHHTLNMGVLPH